MLKVTDSNLEEVIDNAPLILVDFWADWCGPCKKMEPVLEDISNSEKILIGKLNVDENPVKSLEYGVSSIPTMILFKDGSPVKTIVGAKPKHVIMKEVQEWL